jgi:hypothetical protein
VRAPDDRFPPVVFEVSALATQLALSISLRAIAWPEITTPAYLWSRGLVLYRDIKFVHTPGAMGILAIFFMLFGVRTAVVKSFVSLAALASHGFLLSRTRGLPLSSRIFGSAFFLVFYYGWQGNSVWPTALIAILALPLARSLEQGKWSTTGILLGAGILLKQTVAYLLLLVLLRLAVQRRFREASRIALLAALPYWLAAAVFSPLGAGREFLEWTLVVPFQTVGVIRHLPGLGTFSYFLLCGFLPLVLDTAIGLARDEEGETGWLLVTGIGLALLAFPRFDFLQVSASCPCLALGAARLSVRAGKWLKPFSRALVAALVLPQAAALALGERFDGKVLFWNEDPAYNALIEKLKREAPTGPIHSFLWPNILPQTARLPPGGIYIHPWLTYDFPYDRIGERVRLAARRPGSILVGPKGMFPKGVICGPFAFEHIKSR